MSKSIEEEVQEVLNESSDNIQFEEPLDPQGSPLNQPVVENEIGHGKPSVEPAEEETPVEEESTSSEVNEEPASEQEEHQQEEEPDMNFDGDGTGDGVPEQEIGNGEYNDQVEQELAGEEFELPASHARQAADTILGMTDNVLAVGGGFFIKIKKHKEFYDFEEVIQVIDEQNEKNIKRLKLDEEDKILLRPLLITMLKRKAKKLTPEQQLLGAVLSILMKKAQVVMEIRAENEILVERILDVIREEKGYSDQDIDEDEPEQEPEPQRRPAPQYQEPEPEVHTPAEEQPQEEIIEEVAVEEEPQEPLANTVLEVAEEDDTESTGEVE